MPPFNSDGHQQDNKFPVRFEVVVVIHIVVITVMAPCSLVGQYHCFYPEDGGSYVPPKYW
jgi:hypothetical protein